MPTGYTADIYEGKKKVTLEEFVLQCARAFLGNMREESWDTPIPDSLEELNRNEERLNEAKEKVIKYKNMTLEEAAVIIKNGKEDKEKEQDSYNKGQLAMYLRYNEMLTKVEKWQAPKELKHLKKYMIEQLTTSIEHDCSSIIKTPKPADKEQTVKEWLVMMRKMSKEEVVYYGNEIKKEKKNADIYAAWVKTLKDSVRGLQ